MLGVFVHFLCYVASDLSFESLGELLLRLHCFLLLRWRGAA